MKVNIEARRKKILGRIDDAAVHFVEASRNKDEKNKQGAFKEYIRLHKQLGVKLESDTT